MAKILFFDCTKGISGDMTIGALLNLGIISFDNFCEKLSALNIEGYKLICEEVNQNGIKGYNFDVKTDDSSIHNNIDRNIYDILKIIDACNISDNIKKLSKKIFYIQAEEQAKAHGTHVKNMYFNEKGAVDSLIDIIGTSICIDYIGADEIISTPLTDGCGFIKYRFGLLPVPVPAVVNITSSYNIPVRLTDAEGEMVTPTGAAIAAGLFSRYSDSLNENRIISKGIGFGKRSYKMGGYMQCYLLEA